MGHRLKEVHADMPSGHSGRHDSAQRKESDLWSNIESSTNEMPDAAADVERPTGGDGDLSCHVPPILYRKQWRREEWRFALPAVRVPREQPALILAPLWAIRGIRIVNERDRCLALPGGKGRRRLALSRPEIVDANDIEAIDGIRLISKNANAGPLSLGDDTFGDGQFTPRASVVVIAEDADRCEPALREAGEDAAQLVELAVAALLAIRNEVAGEDDDIRLECAHTRERLAEIDVADARADVEIADLGKA